MSGDESSSVSDESSFADSESSNIDVTHRTGRSTRTALLHQALRPFRSQLVKPSGPHPPGSPRLTPHPACSKICSVSERQVADIWIYDLQPEATRTTTSKTTKNAAAAHIATSSEIAHEAAEADTLKKNEKGQGIVRRVYYVAGGSWRDPPSEQHWKFMAKLSAAIPGTAVSVVSVPLAPNETAPTVFPRLLTLYERVMAESLISGERVLWAGDSSGGNIVLGLVGEALRIGRTNPDPDDYAEVAKAKDPDADEAAAAELGVRPDLLHATTSENVLEWISEEQQPVEEREGSHPLPAPSALLIICPSVDARRDNKDIEKIQRHDPILIASESKKHASDWAGDWSLDDERISPAINNTGKDNLVQLLFEKGVKVHGVTAGYDILSPDGKLLRERLAKGGVEGRWLEWDKQMHCFPLAWPYHLPESKEGLEWILSVLNEE